MHCFMHQRAGSAPNWKNNALICTEAKERRSKTAAGKKIGWHSQPSGMKERGYHKQIQITA